jgi:hypothetical protein
VEEIAVTLRIGCVVLVITGLWLGSPLSSADAEVQWKAVLLAGDSSAPVFDNATRDLARLLERRGVQVVAIFSADRAKVSPTVQHATHEELRRLGVTSTPGPVGRISTQGEAPGNGRSLSGVLMDKEGSHDATQSSHGIGRLKW